MTHKEPIMLRLIVIALCLSGAACSLTVFESAPIGAESQCDARLIGTWRTGEWTVNDAEEDPDISDADYFVVDQDCDARNWRTQEPPEELKQFGDASFVTSEGNNYAILPFPSSDGDEDEESDRPWLKGVAIFRYELSGDRLAIYGVDSKYVAAMIHSKAIAGRSIVIDEDESVEQEDDEDVRELRNLIAGSRDQVANMLRKHPKLFYRTPMGVLRRHQGPLPPRAADEGGGETEED